MRATWNPKRGTPGLFLVDAVRGQRFAPNYSGWFAGVPVHINNLGFRDPRDYQLAKGPRTFRIVTLGDLARSSQSNFLKKAAEGLTIAKTLSSAVASSP